MLITTRPRRGHLRARRAMAVAATVAALALVGCTPTGNPGAAATVDGRVVTPDDVRNAYQLLGLNPQAAAMVEDPDGRLELSAIALSQAIRTDAVEQLAADLDVSVSAEDIAAEREAIVAGEFGTEEQFTAFLAENGVSERALTAFLYQNLLSVRVDEALRGAVEVPEVTDADVEEFYDTNINRYATAVVRHILLESEEDAEEVLARLDAGDDFATLAQEVSVDEATAADGGDLGVVSPGLFEGYQELIDAVFEVPVGEPAGPVTSADGVHVILVEQRNVTELDEVRDEIAAEIAETSGPPPGQELDAAIAERLAAADVAVNPRYGRWDPDVREVVVVTSPLRAPADAAPDPAGLGQPTNP